MADDRTESLLADGVVGTLHRPIDPPRAAVVLAHGAGGTRDAAILRAVATELADRGVACARIDLPYRQHRPKGPPSPARAADDRAGVVAATNSLRAAVPNVPVFVGGHSYGGRQASMVLAGDPDVADGLLLTSYPLHPPGKPDRVRTEHLPAIAKPVVIVHGPSDPFATTEEITAAAALIPAPVVVVEIAGAGHDLRPDRAPTARLTVDAVLSHLL